MNSQVVPRQCPQLIEIRSLFGVGGLIEVAGFLYRPTEITALLRVKQRPGQCWTWAVSMGSLTRPKGLGRRSA
jgi:hypothetical protein